MQSTTRPDRAVDHYTSACYVAYALLGWILSGLGAVLPQVRDDLGGQAAVYPSLPGAALLVIGLVAIVRGSAPTRPHRTAVVQGSVALAAGIAVLTLTGAPVVSGLGAALMGATAAGLIRLLPAALTAYHPHDSARVMTRANAWSSLASIAAPLAIGGATAAGIGWRTGLMVAPVVGAVVVAALVRLDRSTARLEPGLGGHTGADASPLATAGESAQAAVVAIAAGAADDAVHGPTRAAAARRPWVDAWLVLTLSIVVEFAFVYFAATFLREEVHLGKAAAAAGAAAFAVGMAASRFLAGPIRSIGDRALTDYLVTIFVGFLVMWFLPYRVTAVTGLAIAGMGTALLYPIGIDRLMRRFPDSVERGAARGALASGTALLSSPALLGALRAVSDVRIAYLSVPVLLVIVAAIHRHAEGAARGTLGS